MACRINRISTGAFSTRPPLHTATTGHLDIGVVARYRHGGSQMPSLFAHSVSEAASAMSLGSIAEPLSTSRRACQTLFNISHCRQHLIRHRNERR